MAIFLLRGEHGTAYTPPAAIGTVYLDIPADAFAADWIEQLAREGVTRRVWRQQLLPRYRGHSRRNGCLHRQGIRSALGSIGPKNFKQVIF